MRLKLLAVMLPLLLLLGIVIAERTPDNTAVIDVSWPNCRVAPKSQYASGIVGVTGGLDFASNPCLSYETSWFANYALYVNTGYPGDAYGSKYQSWPLNCSKDDSPCLGFNYGYNATKYAIRYAALHGAVANSWWLDVETDNSWTASMPVNRASLEGAVMALVQQPFAPTTIGFYSAPAQWAAITGNWQSKLPAWLGTGGSTRATAVQGCRQPAFTGGSLWLSQYTMKLDKNIPCSPLFGQSLTKRG